MAMTLHTAAVKTADIKVFAFRRFFLSICPKCGEVPVAPVRAEFVANGRIRHIWACEDCGHEFRTAVEFVAQDPSAQDPSGDQDPVGEREPIRM
jgi:RNase P subunit RPR2